MKLKTTNIKGKEYVAVNERIRAFRSTKEFEGFQLKTVITKLTEEEIVMEAQVINSDGVLIANGHAHEVKGAGNVNKTSHIENCETSAWGRALGNLGIGVDTSIASSDEVTNAISQQTTNPSPTEKASEKTITQLLKLVQEESGVEPTEKTVDWADSLSEQAALKTINNLKDKLGYGKE